MVGVSEHLVVVVGGTQGLGLNLARRYVEAGRRVLVTGRDAERAAKIAAELGDDVGSAAFDLSEPATIGPALADVGTVDRLALCALDRDLNTVADYDVAAAMRLVTLKLVGYTETIHQLLRRLTPDASIVLYGGLAKLRPYPGSTTITTINHGVDGMVRTMVPELAPIRVNALHPGIVADTPFWEPKTEALEGVRAKTPDRTLGPGARRDRRGVLPAGEPVDERHRAPDRRRLVAHMTDPMTVAVVGAGRMGGAMVGTFRRAGVPVRVWNRTAAAAREVADRTGASAPGTIAGAIDGADVVISSLADDAAVIETYEGPAGVTAAVQEGQVVLEMSTIAPHTVREIAPPIEARGAMLLDAPVSGSVSTVEKGELTIMVGGDLTALDLARPLLEVLATTVFHVGALGAGATMKLAVNSLIHAIDVGLSEALVLAERAGVDRLAAYEIFASGAAAAPFVLYKRDAFERPDRDRARVPHGPDGQGPGSDPRSRRGGRRADGPGGTEP